MCFGGVFYDSVKVLYRAVYVIVVCNFECLLEVFDCCGERVPVCAFVISEGSKGAASVRCCESV